MNTHTKSEGPFILIDGSSYLFRAYYALPPLNNSKGLPTGAIYGVINMLKKLIAQYQPRYVAVIFDPKGGTFRNKLYKEYKANRKIMPDDLQVQIKPLFEIIKALGLPLMIEEGYEADDVIATLAVRAKSEGVPVLISTGDKDLAQIVDESITLVNTMTDRLMDREGVIEKFGIPPERIVDYLTLVGDSTDNIRGIPGVGPKTAVKWLNEYGSLDNLIQHAPDLKGKVGDNFRAHLTEIPLIRTLVTVVSDLKLSETLKDLKRKPQESETLYQLFTELEFKSWLAELSAHPDKKHKKKSHYKTVLERTEFLKWIDHLKKTPLFALDTETTDLDPLRAELVGISFSTKPNEGVYIPLKHDYLGAPQQLNKTFVLEQLKPILENPNTILVGQNLKYDCEVLAREGIAPKAQMIDTLIESYVLNSSGTQRDLNSLTLKYLGKRCTTFEDIAGKGISQLTFNQISIEKASAYASEDADLTLQLHQHLFSLIESDKNYKKVFEHIDMPLMLLLMQMEMHGVLIDAEMLRLQSAELNLRIDELERQAHQLAGHPFNLNSPKQLQVVLFEELKLPIQIKTPGGQPSTAENVLHDLAAEYPLPKVILEHRSLCKLKSTYADRLPEQVNPDTGRVHTSYNQAVTSTGRLSSNNPNLQNIPIRSKEGRKIRQAFIAPEGFQIMTADYSQVELRIIAHISQEPHLIDAFEKELDIHRATAAEVFNVALKEVTTEQRRRAKAINFGLLYGMSSFGLSRQLGIERDLAQKYIDTYFLRYPKVSEYMQHIRTIASQQGYVETLFGRRVYLPDIRSANLQRRRAAERAAINAPMQGSAADIIKIAMITVDRWLKKNNFAAHMIMQVHDELVFEIADRDAHEVILHIKKLMENAAQLSVPLLVDVGTGRNWDEAHA